MSPTFPTFPSPGMASTRAQVAFGATGKRPLVSQEKKDKEPVSTPVPADKPVEVKNAGPTTCVGRIGAFFWGLWPFKGSSAKPVATPTTGDQFETKPPAAASGKKATTPTKPDSKTRMDRPKGFFAKAARLAMNSFQVGATVFLLAISPFMPGPWWVALGLTVGIQLLQNVAHRVYPDTDVTNPRKMKVISRLMMMKYHRYAQKGRQILDKIPLLNYLGGIYDRVAGWGAKISRSVVNFLANRLIPNSVIMQQLPPTFLGKTWYFTKMFCKEIIQVLCKPFTFFPAIKAFFKLEELVEFKKMFAPSQVRPTTPETPIVPEPKPSEDETDPKETPKRPKRTRKADPSVKPGKRRGTKKS